MSILQADQFGDINVDQMYNAGYPPVYPKNGSPTDEDLVIPHP